jgi:hypothetical protein
MNQILIFAIIVISFWSLITTFKAIYTILTKEFKGSKPTWVLIVLIAFIGPILWISKGKKMVAK